MTLRNGAGEGSPWWFVLALIAAPLLCAIPPYYLRDVFHRRRKELCRSIGLSRTGITEPPRADETGR